MLKLYYSDGTEETDEQLFTEYCHSFFLGEPWCSAEDEKELLWETGGECCAQALVDTMFYMCGTYFSL